MLANYSLGECLGNWAGKRKHWPVAVMAVGANLLLLFHFKYSNMFKESLGGLFGFSVEISPVVLPLAISFYTFTQIGYVIDVARNPRVRMLGICFFT